MSKWNELCEAVGVKPDYCSISPETNEPHYCGLNPNKHDCVYCQAECKEFYPVPIADEVLALEQILFKRFVEWELSNYDEKYQYQVSDGQFQGLLFRTSEATRTEALASLLIQLIEKNIISKEEVRKVIEQ
jgi:hypothetical protein